MLFRCSTLGEASSLQHNLKEFSKPYIKRIVDELKSVAPVIVFAKVLTTILANLLNLVQMLTASTGLLISPLLKEKSEIKLWFKVTWIQQFFTLHTMISDQKPPLYWDHSIMETVIYLIWDMVSCLMLNRKFESFGGLYQSRQP